MQETATAERADLVLFLLVDAIKGSKVDVGGRLVNVHIVVTGPEDARNEKELVWT